jgi:S-(hydroxymethyl)glutathione dehydrogenase/alcohol dehydrogenase
MKAGIFNGQKIQLSEISKPNLILDDEVLIKVKSTGICGSDLRIIHGKDEPDTLPIGH